MREQYALICMCVKSADSRRDDFWFFQLNAWWLDGHFCEGPILTVQSLKKVKTPKSFFRNSEPFKIVHNMKPHENSNNNTLRYCLQSSVYDGQMLFIMWMDAWENGMMLRWPTERANDRYKDHLEGQLTSVCGCGGGKCVKSGSLCTSHCPSTSCLEQEDIL